MVCDQDMFRSAMLEHLLCEQFTGFNFICTDVKQVRDFILPLPYSLGRCRLLPLFPALIALLTGGSINEMEEIDVTMPSGFKPITRSMRLA